MKYQYRRALRRKAGVCIECGDGLSERSIVFCEPHRLLRNAMKSEARLRRLESDRAKDRERMKKRRASLHAAGGCTECGKITQFWKCLACRLKQNAMTQKRVRRAKLALLVAKPPHPSPTPRRVHQQAGVEQF